MRVAAAAGRRRLVAFVLAAGVCVLAGPSFARAQAIAVGTVTNYTDPSISTPIGVAAGPDGALWFTNQGNDSIGRISTTGTVSHFGITSDLSGPYGIAAGPGGMWFTNPGNNGIGILYPDIGAVSVLRGPDVNNPVGITPGSDGNVWFTNYSNNSIVRILTSGVVGAMDAFTDPSIDNPAGIAAGPDGALWFTNNGNDSIGRISTDGTVTNYTGPGISAPFAIAAGPDGALWFTNENNDSIGRISTDGTVTNYTGPGISGPVGIAAGPDGALWFTNGENDSIGRISVGGKVTNYTGPGIKGPLGIAAGPDGGMWFANHDNNSVGRIQAAGYAATVSTTPGLLAYWRLGESAGTTAADETGAHNGTYVGGHTLGVAGALQGDANTAVALDGTSGQIRAPSLGTAANWTVEGWTDLNADASKNPAGNNALYASSGGVRLLIRPGGVYAGDLTTGPSKAVVQKSTASNVGSWVYWALVRQGATLTVYRNATAVGSVTLSKPAVSSLLDGAIGAFNKPSHLHGNVDEVAVYNSALAPETLLRHYQLAGYGLGRCAGVPASILGSGRADRLVGTPKRNVIIGGSGNDRISADGGSDLVCAGAGNDHVVGGAGNDKLLGEAGNDILVGGPGNDSLVGGSGSDILVGGSGNDRINPGPGRDHVFAGPGNDVIFARDGHRDVIDCGAGHDRAIVDRLDRTRRCEIVLRAAARRR